MAADMQSTARHRNKLHTSARVCLLQDECVCVCVRERTVLVRWPNP